MDGAVRTESQYDGAVMRLASAVLGLALVACAPAEPDTRPAAPSAAPVATVTWPANVQKDVLAQLSVAAQQVVTRSPVPALVVDDADMLRRATVMAQPKWYAVSTQGAGVTVSIHATSHAHHYAHIDEKPHAYRWVVRGQPALVTQNEAIWSAAWTEGGVAYSLEVECSSLPDPRCESESYVMQLADKLAFVGGSGVSQ